MTVRKKGGTLLLHRGDPPEAGRLGGVGRVAVCQHTGEEPTTWRADCTHLVPAGRESRRLRDGRPVDCARQTQGRGPLLEAVPAQGRAKDPGGTPGRRVPRADPGRFRTASRPAAALVRVGRGRSTELRGGTRATLVVSSTGGEEDLRCYVNPPRPCAAVDGSAGPQAPAARWARTGIVRHRRVRGRARSTFAWWTGTPRGGVRLRESMRGYPRPRGGRRLRGSTCVDGGPGRSGPTGGVRLRAIGWLEVSTGDRVPRRAGDFTADRATARRAWWRERWGRGAGRGRAHRRPAAAPDGPARAGPGRYGGGLAGRAGRSWTAAIRGRVRAEGTGRGSGFSRFYLSGPAPERRTTTRPTSGQGERIGGPRPRGHRTRVWCMASDGGAA